MIYYGTKLSENISVREPEGYLLCLNVPVARTGTQEYLPEELGIPPLEYGKMIPVYRPEEEVFSPECMASFEGMPVTNDHPDEGVSVDNWRKLGMGEVHNIRRGTGEESDLLLADLIIKDRRLIDLIVNEGKREISCGYTYELCEEDGKYVQRQIRGNHVAVVDAGRAGHRVCIKDHDPKERRPKIMKKSLYKKLCKMARDGDPEALEAVAEIAEEILEAGEDPSVEVVVAPEAAPVEAIAETSADPAASEPEAGVVVSADEDGLAGIIERLDTIIGLLKPAAAPAADEDPVEEIVGAVEEAVAAVAAGEETPAEAEAEAVEEIAEVVEEVVEDPMSSVIDPTADECGDPEEPQNSTSDALRAALSAIRPALTKMSRKQRQRVSADIAAKLKASQKGPSAYVAIAAAKDGKSETDIKDLGKRIMEKRNPNYGK